MIEQLHQTCPIYCCFVIFIFGLIFGSFLNVVVLRAFSGESIIFPPSKCPSCKTQLKWYHNLPVLSYLFLKGRCAFCKEKISLQYPIIELLTGVGFLSNYLYFGYSWQMIFACVFFFLSLVIIVTDIKEQVVFVQHTYFLAGFGILFHLFNVSQYTLRHPTLEAILGIFVGFLIIELIARVTQKLFGHRAFGDGDSYILAAIGAIVGYKLVLSVLAIAILLQVVFSYPILAIQFFKTKKYDLLISSIVFIGVAFTLKLFENSITNNILHLSLLFLLFVTGILFSLKLIQNIKNGISLTPLPFGPALLLAGWFVFLFQNRPIEPFWMILVP